MLKNLNRKKNGLVIADSGPIFSLAIIDKLDILNQFFDEVLIPVAVWKEITYDKSTDFYPSIVSFFQDNVRHIKGINHLTFIMDYGESESVILYKESNAQFLLIDDKKARQIAENFNVKCIGTLGILLEAKKLNIISELKPIFIKFLQNKRYYNTALLDQLLTTIGETPLE